MSTIEETDESLALADLQEKEIELELICAVEEAEVEEKYRDAMNKLEREGDFDEMLCLWKENY